MPTTGVCCFLSFLASRDCKIVSKKSGTGKVMSQGLKLVDGKEDKD